MNKLILILLYASIMNSCSQPKLLIFYGTEQKFLVYSDSSIVDGEVVLNIDDYTFKFHAIDFENELAEQLKDYHKSDFDYLLEDFIVDNYQFVIKKVDNKLILNDSAKVKFPLDSSIISILDDLIKDGKFYLSKNGEQIKYMEHIYWNPQYQGSISSKWIVEDKTINEIIHGFVD